MSLQDVFNPYTLQVVVSMGVNALLALSVWLPMSAGQLSLGAAGFMSVGAYTAALLTLQAGWPPVAGIAVGAMTAAALAYGLGYPVLRLQGVYLAIATLGFGEMVRVVVLNLRITRGALGLAGIPRLADDVAFWLEEKGWLPFGETWLGLDGQTWGDLVVIGALAFLLAAVLHVLAHQQRSRVGRALAAIQADPMAAEAMGIDVAKYRLLVFTQSGFLAGLAGGLYAHMFSFIGPADFGYHRAIEALVFVVLGGQEMVWGPLLGAGLVTMLPELLRSSPSYRAILYGLVLLGTVLLLPQGLLTRASLQRLGIRVGPITYTPPSPRYRRGSRHA